MVSKKFSDLVYKMAEDSENPEYNHDLAVEYEAIGQTAAAIGFYLRAVEYGYKSRKQLTYASLIKIGILLEEQNDRDFSCSNVLLQAVEFMPERPEAYYYLGKYYQKKEMWQEAYTNFSVGLYFYDKYKENSFMTSIPRDKYLVGKAFCGYYVGRAKESKESFSLIFGPSEINNIVSVLENIKKAGL